MTVTASQTVKFHSPNRELRLVRRNAAERMNHEGRMVVTQPEVVYEFHLGWLEVTPGQDPLPDTQPVDPMTGEGELQDAVSWLRAFSVINGRFSEVVEVVPDPGPELLALAEAQIAKDLAAVEAIGDTEALGYARPEVMDRAKQAYDALKPKD